MASEIVTSPIFFLFTGEISDPLARRSKLERAGSLFSRFPQACDSKSRPSGAEGFLLSAPFCVRTFLVLCCLSDASWHQERATFPPPL